MILLPTYIFKIENIKSFSLRIQYNEVFLDYGSFYAPGLSDLGFFKSNNQGSTILVAVPAQMTFFLGESINLYFYSTDSAFFETNIFIDNIA